MSEQLDGQPCRKARESHAMWNVIAVGHVGLACRREAPQEGAGVVAGAGAAVGPAALPLVSGRPNSRLGWRSMPAVQRAAVSNSMLQSQLFY